MKLDEATYLPLPTEADITLTMSAGIYITNFKVFNKIFIVQYVVKQVVSSMNSKQFSHSCWV